MLRVCDFFEVWSRYIHFQAVRDRRWGNPGGSPDHSDDLFFPFSLSLPGAWVDLRPYDPARYAAKCITL